MTRTMIIGLCGLVLGGIPGWVVATGDIIRISGSGAGLATLERLGASYSAEHSGVEVKVLPTLGSTGAIRALTSGQLELAVATRPLTADEHATGLQAMEYARTPFGIAVREDAPMVGLSTTEAAEVYAGTRRHWPDGRPIRLVLRPASDSDHDALRRISPAFAEAMARAHERPGLRVASTDQKAADALAALPGAAGSATLAIIRAERRPLRLLALDGIAPDLDNLATGRYPHFKSLYLVIRGDASPAVRHFLALLETPAAHALLRDHGQLPLTGAAEYSR